MHWLFSATVHPCSALILHEIKPLPDVTGGGTVNALLHKPFYPGRYVLSTTIRGDIRIPATAPVPRWFDEVQRHVQVKRYSFHTAKDTSAG